MAVAILAQGNSLEQSERASRQTVAAHVAIVCNEEKTKSKTLPEEDEEQDPLFYDLPLSRLLSWNRWWHLTAQAIRLVFQKRSWGVAGSYLRKKKGIATDRLVLFRANWSARGQELKYIKHLGVTRIAPRHR